MKKLLLTIGLLVLTSVVLAANVVNQRYIDQMTRGGNISIKQAAQSIYNTGAKDTEVLDVAAEVLLQRYPTAGNADIDTLAWLTRALGSSRNSRYHTALLEVVDSNAHAKLRKYAKKALKEVGGLSGDQYVKGTVDLVALRNAEPGGGSDSAAQASAAAEAAATASSGKAGLDVLVPGMLMQEVYDLVGHPTNTTTYQTGKAWIPFNYGAKDVARTLLLYKGKGRVVCSHDGYSANSKVLEVIIDPKENGYP